MQIKKEKLAIIAGGGDLVLSSIKFCKTQNINYFLIGVKEFYNNLAFPADAYLSLNNIGNINNSKLVSKHPIMGKSSIEKLQYFLKKYYE